MITRIYATPAIKGLSVVIFLFRLYEIIFRLYEILFRLYEILFRTITNPANTKYCPSADLILVHRFRRWPNIN